MSELPKSELPIAHGEAKVASAFLVYPFQSSEDFFAKQFRLSKHSLIIKKSSRINGESSVIM